MRFLYTIPFATLQLATWNSGDIRFNMLVPAHITIVSGAIFNKPHQGVSWIGF
jgi:hypothetical protein